MSRFRAATTGGDGKYRQSERWRSRLIPYPEHILEVMLDQHKSRIVHTAIHEILVPIAPY